jgi:hypothetical protein
MTFTAPLVPTPAEGFVTRMETVEGTPAQWPITHTFIDAMDGQHGTQHAIVAETPASARELLLATMTFQSHLVYMQSQDAAGRFVYDFS